MLIDQYNRKIDYLRISVTDRCNLRCLYCMPASGISNLPHSEILSFEQIHRIVKVAVRLRIRKVRLTGGEPLVRKDLPLLIEKLKNIGGLDEICLTTNGIYLGEYARGLKDAGLTRVNISLDTLIPERFSMLTRGGSLRAVLEAIDISLSLGLAPVKINMVLLRGFNTDETVAFGELTRSLPLQVRFIEYMPCGLGWQIGAQAAFSADEVKSSLSSLGGLEPVKEEGSSHARVFRINGFEGTVAFISPLSQPFCFSCNKLRLSSDGYLKSCLHSGRGVSLKEALAGGDSDDKLSELICRAVALKPYSHHLGDPEHSFEPANFSMCQIGG